MSDVTAVLAEIDAHRASHLQRLMAYLRRPSISAEGVGIVETAAFLAAELTRIGLRAELLPSSGSPMVFAEWSGAPGRPTILLYGHYDVQPAGDPAAWLSLPFEPTVRDGRLYARGAGDNKGQHFAHLLALEVTLARTGRLPCNVKVLLEGEEEIGSPSLPAFVRDHRAELAADLVVTSDGPQDVGGSPVLQFGARGVISFELRAHGANRDLHSGNWGGVAPNPVWTLVHLLATMKNAAGEITIDGLHDGILPLTPAERAVQGAMPLDLPAVMASLGIDRLDAPPDRGFFDRLTTWPTLTINGLHGGYGGPGSMTVLPREAVAKCDVRLVEAQSAVDVYAKIVAHVRRHAPEVEIVHQGAMDPSRTPVDSRFTEPILRAIELGQGRAPVRLLAMGGSLPDYVFTKTLGVPAFTIPYANADEANHAPNENIEVELFLRGIRTTAALLDAIGDMEGPA